jgi:glyceraldehyde-3-phosphate dehydrogenase/erythrose-4-phosphate dehydrogenase
LEESVEFIPIANKPSSIEVVAINDIADKTMAHLIKYDSIHGVLPFFNKPKKEF